MKRRYFSQILSPAGTPKTFNLDRGEHEDGLRDYPGLLLPRFPKLRPHYWSAPLADIDRTYPSFDCMHLFLDVQTRRWNYLAWFLANWESSEFRKHSIHGVALAVFAAAPESNLPDRGSDFRRFRDTIKRRGKR